MLKYSLFFYTFLLFLAPTVKAQTPQLWGLTSNGGDTTGNRAGNGVIFKMNLDGSGFDTAHLFKGYDGDSAKGTLLKAIDGKLYGMTSRGGKNGTGVIFSIDPTNNEYTDVYDFDMAGYPSGSSPYGSLIQDTNGIMYGMANSGGAYSYGAIFSFNPTNTTYKDIFDFNFTDGGRPYFGNLILVGGNLYGLTSVGGAYGDGVLFSINPTDSSYSDLHDFGNASDTNNNEGFPFGSLLQASNGKFYGMCHLIQLSGGANYGGCIFSFNPDSGTYKEVYNFPYSFLADPYGSLIQLGDSLLYGMTYSGGDSSAGNIFSFNTNNDSVTDLYNFGPLDADQPYGNLFQAANNKLYGMTSQGGYGWGNIFSFDLDSNTYEDVYDFDNSTGSNPLGSLIQIIGTSGIDQLPAINSRVSIFPNPAANQLTIKSYQLSISKISVETVLGQTIIEKSFGTGIKQKTIDVSALSQGIYFITITSDTQTTSLKFIVAR